MSKRIDILQAAAKIINNGGIHEITISKVAKEAGIGKSTVYEYFISKEELVKETIGYVGELYLDTIKTTIKTSNDGFEMTMKKLIGIVMEGIRKGNNYYLLMMSECKKSGAPPHGHGNMKELMMGFRMKLYEILDMVLDMGEKEGLMKKPKDKLYLLVWQNLFVVLSFEFSGVDAFVEMLGIDILQDDPKNIDTIYGYMVRMLQVGLEA